MEVRDFACEDDDAAEAKHVRGIETWLKPRHVSRIGQSRDGADQSDAPPSTSIASTFSG